MKNSNKSCSVGHLAENIVEDSPISPECYFGLCVKPNNGGKLLPRTCSNLNNLVNFKTASIEADRELFLPTEAELLGVFSILELER